MNTTDATQPLPDDLQALISRYGSLDEFNALLDQSANIDELIRMIDEHGGLSNLDQLLGPLPDPS